MAYQFLQNTRGYANAQPLGSIRSNGLQLFDITNIASNAIKIILVNLFFI